MSEDKSERRAFLQQKLRAATLAGNPVAMAHYQREIDALGPSDVVAIKQALAAAAAAEKDPKLVAHDRKVLGDLFGSPAEPAASAAEPTTEPTAEPPTGRDDETRKVTTPGRGQGRRGR